MLHEAGFVKAAVLPIAAAFRARRARVKIQPTITTKNLANPTQYVQTAKALSHQARRISLINSIRPDRNGKV